MVRVRAKNWCFTWNNPPTGGLELVKHQIEDLVDYAIMQLEVGEQGTPHIQGYMCCKQQYEMLAAKALIHHNDAKMTKANGTWEQNRTYCTKTEGRLDGPIKIGEEPRATQGVSSLRLRATDEVVAGRNPGTIEFAREYPSLYIQNSTMLGLIRLFNVLSGGPRSTKPCVIILWGPGGVGKSYRVHEMPGEKFWKMPGKWWDGYAYQRNVVFNDFDPTAWDYSWNDFKRLTDWCPVRYECKGLYGGIEFNSPVIFITANTNPRYWWEVERTREQGVWDNRDIHVYPIVSLDS